MVIKLKKRKLVIAILLFCLIILTGCKNNGDNNQSDKISKELDFLDIKIVNILNELNNINMQNYTITSEEITMDKGSKSSSESESENSSNSSSKTEEDQQSNNVTVTQMEMLSTLDLDRNNIDWKSIKNDIETINSSWGVILTDLSGLNLASEDILGFSNTLNDCMISIKNEDKIKSLENMAKLYGYIPKYEQVVETSGEIKNLKQTKAELINAYSIIESENWNEITPRIIRAETEFKKIIDNIEAVKNKEYKINKTYVLIEEMKNAVAYKDKELLYVKYKDLMESLNTI